MPYRPTEATRTKAAQRRDRILGATASIVAVGGWRSVTIGTVACQADVSSGSVYTHFPDKAALVAETFRRLAEREQRAVAAATDAAAEPDDGHAAERGIAALVQVFAHRALQAPRLAWALLAEPAGPEVEAARLDFRRHYVQILHRIIASGIASGEIPPQDPGLASAALVGAVGEALTGPLSPAAEHPDPDTLIRGLQAFCRGAVGLERSTHEVV